MKSARQHNSLNNLWNKLKGLHPVFLGIISAILLLIIIYSVRLTLCNNTDTSTWIYSPLTGINRTFSSLVHPCIMGKNGTGIWGKAGYPDFATQTEAVNKLWRSGKEDALLAFGAELDNNYRKDHCSGVPGSHSWWKDLLQFEQQNIYTISMTGPTWWNEEIRLSLNRRGPYTFDAYSNLQINGFSTDSEVDWRKTKWAASYIQSDILPESIPAEKRYIQQLNLATKDYLERIEQIDKIKEEIKAMSVADQKSANKALKQALEQKLKANKLECSTRKLKWKDCQTCFSKNQKLIDCFPVDTAAPAPTAPASDDPRALID